MRRLFIYDTYAIMRTMGLRGHNEANKGSPAQLEQTESRGGDDHDLSRDLDAWQVGELEEEGESETKPSEPWSPRGCKHFIKRMQRSQSPQAHEPEVTVLMPSGKAWRPAYPTPLKDIERI